MAGHTLHQVAGGRYYLILALAFVTALAALGGASRADEIQQALIRFAAIFVVAAALWPLDFAVFRDAREPIIAFGLICILLIAQLLPLPPGLWARMPGHDLYFAVAQQTNSSIAWRPWTVSPDRTLNALAALLPAASIGLVTLALDFRSRIALARLVVVLACISSTLGLLQLAAGGSALHLFHTTSENSAVGLFANRNHEAVFMACGLPIVAALAVIQQRNNHELQSRKGFAISAIILLLMGLAATGSRMGLLLGLVGLAAAAAIYAIGTRGAASSKRLWVAGTAAATVATVPVTLLVARSGSVARLASDPVDQTRMTALGPMLHAARAFLPFGAGYGTFEPVYQRFEPNSLLSTIYLNQAHNEPVQLAIEGGLPALLLLILFLGWWLHASVRAVRPRGSESRRALATAMTAVTLILLLSSLVDYPLRTPLLSGLFTIACVELVRSKRGSGLSPSR